MAIQKIQASAKSAKGFTLVELIVVITILVILGTIAFLNLGGFSSQARDSQRTSDVNQINTQIMTMQAKNGAAYSSMITSNSNSQLSPVPSVGGTGTVLNTSYFAGDVNYSFLGVDVNKMADPTAKVPYKMGSTTAAGSAYEIAAALEDTKTALVMGTYRARAAATASGTVAIGATKFVLTNSTDIGKFRVGDYVTEAGGGTANNTISSISADGLTINLSTTQATATGTALTLAVESTGLVKGTGSTSPATNGGTVLPY